ncbi:unnamed protein product [Symbiodinium sp. KB8]|nr:unnamed protein product [Symbiodinium sp. KB8]
MYHKNFQFTSNTLRWQFFRVVSLQIFRWPQRHRSFRANRLANIACVMRWFFSSVGDLEECCVVGHVHGMSGRRNDVDVHPGLSGEVGFRLGGGDAMRNIEPFEFQQH